MAGKREEIMSVDSRTQGDSELLVALPIYVAVTKQSRRRLCNLDNRLIILRIRMMS